MKYLIPITQILGSPITSLRLEEQVYLMLTWAKKHKSKVICLANSHMLMEAYWNKSFAKVLQTADLVSPDGMPIVWMLKFMGFQKQNRVAGMDVFSSLCRLASISNINVFFLGSQKEVLDLMKEKLVKDFPFLSIAGMESLPFRPLNPEEDEVLIKKINSSDAGLIFVCLGCPKQEKWMAEHKDKINGVMIGVGAVFAVYAGLQKRAPHIIRLLGLEWLYRLLQDPKRLWTRYRKTIPPFLYLAFKELLSHQKDKNLSIKYNYKELAESHKKVANDFNHTSHICDFNQAKTQQFLPEKSIIPENCLQNFSEEQKRNQNKNKHVKIGEILIEKKIITSEQLNEILLEQLCRQKEIKI